MLVASLIQPIFLLIVLIWVFFEVQFLRKFVYWCHRVKLIIQIPTDFWNFLLQYFILNGILLHLFVFWLLLNFCLFTGSLILRCNLLLTPRRSCALLWASAIKHLKSLWGGHHLLLLLLHLQIMFAAFITLGYLMMRRRCLIYFWRFSLVSSSASNPWYLILNRWLVLIHLRGLRPRWLLRYLLRLLLLEFQSLFLEQGFKVLTWSWDLQFLRFLRLSHRRVWLHTSEESAVTLWFLIKDLNVVIELQEILLFVSE